MYDNVYQLSEPLSGNSEVSRSGFFVCVLNLFLLGFANNLALLGQFG